MNETEHQAILDAEHLHLLRIGYFIQGGTTLLLCLFGLLYVFLGIAALSSLPGAPVPRGGPQAQVMGYVFALMGALFTIGGAVLAVLKFLTARALRRRSGRMLCMITAAISCIFVPYGTAIGVFTFIVLGRPSVRLLFGDRSADRGGGGVSPAAPAG